jgi:uncharacterized membrane protein YfcA
LETASLFQWIVVLFLFTLTIGIIAPISGVGGGVLFVPIATAFFPFSVDFVRGTGLLMALISSISSSPRLIRAGMANVRFVSPVATVSIITSVLGSLLGLYITNNLERGESYITLTLGILLLFIILMMILSRRVEFPEAGKVDPLSRILGLRGEWYEPSMGRVVSYRATNLPWGLLAFGGVGFLAGMFGVGAGWASVPVLNLVMGVPIKAAAATSMAIITVNSAAATWVYLARGALLPLVCVPSVIGIAVGAWIGARIAEISRPRAVRYVVMVILVFAAAVDLTKGLQGLLVP